MKVGIMQPYFFPYIGYWNLIAATDEWIFFDIPKYKKKSWMSRNRIIHFDNEKEFTYINVPVKKTIDGTPVKDVLINNDSQWKQAILGKLTVYKKLNAPFYEDVYKLINTAIQHQTDRFTDLLEYSFQAVFKYIGLAPNYRFISQTDYVPESGLTAGEWALSIAKYVGADEYINPMGGVNIFDPDKYNEQGIKISFLKPSLSPYKQSRRSNFIAGLSIIDALMFLPPDEILHRLTNDYDLLTHNEAMGRSIV